MSKHTIHSFTSRKQAEEIRAILGRIGDCGGKGAFKIEVADYTIGQKNPQKVLHLSFDTTVWAGNIRKETDKGNRNNCVQAEPSRFDPDPSYIDFKVAQLNGMVRGLVYAKGGGTR
jgi:hypothetical protein